MNLNYNTVKCDISKKINFLYLIFPSVLLSDTNIFIKFQIKGNLWKQC